MKNNTKKKEIIIIDYQLGNLFSVNQALTNIGLNTRISCDPKDIANADAIVLPGVGAFGDAMKNLKEMGLIESIKEYVKSGKPFLGICLGLQLLFDESEEFGSTQGLGMIKGYVKRFYSKQSPEKGLKVPQIAWNQVFKGENRSWDNTPLMGIKQGEYVYFVHSYYVEPLEDVAITYTTYGKTKYVSSILKNNIFACQFHPEKSADEGLKIYRNWALQNNLL